MPELAEVEFFRKQWNPGLGQTVRRVHTHPQARIFRESKAPDIHRHLTDSQLEQSMAHGKKLCFQFSGDRWLGLHLGMAGKLLTAAPEIVPARHEHLVFVMETVALVFSDYRMFGKVQLHSGKEKPVWWVDLPPQPQEAAFTADRLWEILRHSPRRPLKALLLDQEYFPGIGNWMADEILWRARIHPAQRSSELSSYFRYKLFHSLKTVCDDALSVIAPDWGHPPDSWLFNHRWKRDTRCPVSGKPLKWITVGGRTTCYSPSIQKLR